MKGRKLYRSTENKVFAGVCGGIGDYFNIDPVIVRLLWVIASLFSFGAGLLGYIIAALVIPVKAEDGGEKRRTGCLTCLLIVLAAVFFLPVVAVVLRVLYSLLPWNWGGVTGSGDGASASLISFSPFFAVTGLAAVLFVGVFIVVVIWLIVLLVKKSNRGGSNGE